MLSTSLLAAAALPALALALATSLPVHTLDQLALGSWLENIAVRPNGHLLVTAMEPSATLYTIKHPSFSSGHLDALVNITSIQNIYGIAELPSAAGETYLLVGGNSSSLAHPVTGSFSAWTVQFGQGKCEDDVVRVDKVSDLSEQSAFLNGVSAIPGVPDAVLIADSAAGLVGRLDVSTGAYDADAFSFLELAPAQGAQLPIGVNGIHVRGGHLYFTNSFLVSIFRVAVTPSGLPSAGAAPELVANLSSQVNFLDDFTFDADGNIYAAANSDNSIAYVDVETGESRIVAGSVDSLAVAGPTSAAFGRGKHDKDILYVPTGGALSSPVGGNKTEGAKVVAINTEP